MALASLPLRQAKPALLTARWGPGFLKEGWLHTHHLHSVKEEEATSALTKDILFSSERQMGSQS